MRFPPFEKSDAVSPGAISQVVHLVETLLDNVKAESVGLGAVERRFVCQEVGKRLAPVVDQKQDLVRKRLGPDMNRAVFPVVVSVANHVCDRLIEPELNPADGVVFFGGQPRPGAEVSHETPDGG